MWTTDVYRPTDRRPTNAADRCRQHSLTDRPRLRRTDRRPTDRDQPTARRPTDRPTGPRPTDPSQIGVAVSAKMRTALHRHVGVEENKCGTIDRHFVAVENFWGLQIPPHMAVVNRHLSKHCLGPPWTPLYLLLGPPWTSLDVFRMFVSPLLQYGALASSSKAHGEHSCVTSLGSRPPMTPRAQAAQTPRAAASRPRSADTAQQQASSFNVVNCLFKCAPVPDATICSVANSWCYLTSAPGHDRYVFKGPDCAVLQLRVGATDDARAAAAAE